MSAPFCHFNNTHINAQRAYAAGYNVIPMPKGKKGGFIWKQNLYIRLPYYALLTHFQPDDNLALITGRESGNLFILDCETDATFQEQMALLKLAKIPICAVRSGGAGGGGHIHLRCLEGEVENIRSGLLRDMEVRGNRNYVLAPPSIHPDTGSFYEVYCWDVWQPPLVSIHDLSWLPLKVRRKQAKPPPYLAELSQRNRDFVLHGAPEHERNNRLFRAACDLLGNHYSLPDVRHLAGTAALRSGLSSLEVEKTIQSAASQPRTPSKPYAKNNHHLSEAKIAAVYGENHYPWKGRTRMYDRAAFMACCTLGEHQSMNGVFRASCRELAELARMMPTTAGKALKRLVEYGLLEKCGEDKDTGGHLYRFTLQTQSVSAEELTIYANDDTPAFPPFGGLGVAILQNLPDAAEFKALGKTAFLIYRVMCAFVDPQKVKVIAEAAHVSTGSVYCAFRRLKKFGLLYKMRRLYGIVRLTDTSLELHVSVPAGTYGRGEARRKRHQRERQGYAAGQFYDWRYKSRGAWNKLMREAGKSARQVSGEFGRFVVVAHEDVWGRVALHH